MKKKLLSLVLATVMVTGTGATVWASGDGEVIEKYGTELTNLDLDGTLHGTPLPLPENVMIWATGPSGEICLSGVILTISCAIPFMPAL